MSLLSLPEDFSFKRFGKQLLEEFKADRVTGLAREVAYSTIFAIPPLLILVIVIAALLNNVADVPVAETLRDAITDYAPGSAQDILKQLVDNAIAQVGSGALTFGLIITLGLALYGGSGAVGAFIDAFNIAYEVQEQRPFLKKFAVRIGLTLLLGIGAVVAFTLFVFGERIGLWIAELVGLGDAFTLLWNILRWPVAILVVLLLLAVLYYLGPNIEQSFRWVSPGSVVAALLWILSIFGFRLYLAFSNPGSAYGVAGSVIVLLFFLYVSAVVFILGAEINAVLQKRYDPETVKDLAQSPEKTSPETHQAAKQRTRKGVTTDDRPSRGRQLGHAAATGSQEPTPERRSVGLKGWLGAGAWLGVALLVEKIRGGKDRSTS